MPFTNIKITGHDKDMKVVDARTGKELKPYQITQRLASYGSQAKVMTPSEYGEQYHKQPKAPSRRDIIRAYGKVRLATGTMLSSV